jgi:opacity protein-like surface antigen
MMQPTLRLAAAIVFLAAPLAAQNDRAVIARISGGGADHLADLAPGAPTWFMPGYSIGAGLGVQLTRHFALRGDFTFTRNPTRGVALFDGQDINRFFYGVNAEYRPALRPFGFTPYGFAGMGAVSIDQLGLDAFKPATRFAVSYGGGFSRSLTTTPLEFFGELKGMTYRWNMLGYNRNMIDVVFTAGVSYRRPF